MTLNGFKVQRFSQEGTILILTIVASSIETAKTCITEDMVILDSVGNQFNRFVGYTNIDQIVVNENAGTYEFYLNRDDSYDTELVRLKAKLQAAIEANAFLEECIVEMAGVVYA